MNMDFNGSFLNIQLYAIDELNQLIRSSDEHWVIPLGE
jgi:hypothetical protein